jgi:hypothetical protein
MAKSFEEKARDKKPLVRSSVATDEKAPLKLLELLSNDPEDMVRGDVATNESASEDILRKLSKDLDESVRCAVASNSSTPLDVLAVLLTDQSKYVKQNAKDNPNAKKIGSDKKSLGATPKKVTAVKKSNPKAKLVNGEFSSQELTASMFSYTPAEFKKIKLKTELKKWQEDLDGNSSSYPTYIGSPFDDSNLNLETEHEDSELDEELVYVIPHYFYESAEYAIDGKIDSSWSIMLAPILGKLLPSMPMDFAQKGEDQVWFEGQGATDGTEPEISFYLGSKLIATCSLEDMDAEFLMKVTSAI